MRQRGRTDNNHQEIMDYLRDKMSAVVQDLSSVGDGCPDLLVGWRGLTFLLEVKDGTKTPGNRKLTVKEADWHATWAGLPVIVALSGEDAVLQVLTQAGAREALNDQRQSTNPGA